MKEQRRGHESPLIDASTYRRAVRHHWWLVVVGMLTGLILATAFVSLREPEYEATATVETAAGYLDLSGATTLGAPTAMITEQSVAKSVSVVSATLTATQSDLSVAEFNSRATVSAVPESTILVFTFKDSSAAGATSEVESWADQYLDYRYNSLEASYEKIVKRLNQQMTGLNKTLRTAQNRVNETLPGTRRSELAESELDLAIREVAEARSRASGVRAVLIQRGTLLGTPQYPSTTDQVPAGAIVGSALLLGALLGFLLALMRELTRARVRRVSDLEIDAGAQVWAEIPGGDTSDLATRQALDALASRIVIAAQRGDSHVVVIAAPNATVHDLAGQLLERLNRLRPTSLLTDLSELLDTVSTTRPSLAPTSASLMLVAAPAILEDPRTAVLSSEADLTILVATDRHTRMADMRSAIRKLNDEGVNPALVFEMTKNRVARKTDSSKTRATTAHERVVSDSQADAQTDPNTLDENEQ